MIFRLRKFKIFYKYMAAFFVLLFLLFLSLAFLIHRFPLQANMSGSYGSKWSYFLVPWPTLASEKDALERKRLKRYNKAEQKRRLEKQQQEMHVLNAPIYDPIFDNGLSFTSSSPFSSFEKTSFLWPIIPTQRSFKYLDNQEESKRSFYILFPNPGWDHILEGFHLASGEEFKSEIPLKKEKRNLKFDIFPLTQGNIRVTLGQNVWSHTFRENDVQRKSSFSIPIYDSTATNFKVTSVSLNCYIANLSVDEILYNGREPIQVSKESNLWVVSPHPNNNSEPQPEDKNAQFATNDKHSTALGYNVVFIHLNHLNERILKNDRVLSKVSPNLFEMLKSSFVFENISVPNNSFDSFRKFIFPDERINLAEREVAKDIIDSDKIKNTYSRFRKYGYKTLSIAPPQALFFSDKLARDGHISQLYNRWLNKQDWLFEKKNMELDERAEPASGLEAIFKPEEKEISLPLDQTDYKNISASLLEASKNNEQAPNWNSNEYLFMDSSSNYIPMVLQSFQDWTSENFHSRFFAHVFLNDKGFSDRPFMKDMMHSLFSNGASLFLNPKRIGQGAYMSLVDRSLGQILDTLKTRKIENRTILFLLISSDEKKGRAVGVFHVPGLLPKRNTEITQSVVHEKDILATLFSTIGISSGINMEKTEGYNFGKMLEVSQMQQQQPAANTAQTGSENYFKYSMLIEPGHAGCSPFVWKPYQAHFFGLKANYPIYNVLDDGRIEFFPCALKDKWIQITWYQKREGTPPALEDGTTLMIPKIGGNFVYPNNIESLPEFYFGKDLISAKKGFLGDHFNESALAESFFIKNDKIDEAITRATRSFLTLDSAFQDDPLLNGKSKVAFFISSL